MKTITTWKQQHEFEADHDGNTIHIDGEKKNGHGPKALLLSGLAGCSGIDVVDILGKMKIEFSNLRMEAEATLADDHPKVFTNVHITYFIKTAPEHEDRIKKAIELSLDKYCGVAAMLKKNSPLQYTLVIES
ncbi:MAG: OsmC family protein [Bacteroidetes bacterium]|nr:OsmC family protein [Bacteroidota bacterium]